MGARLPIARMLRLLPAVALAPACAHAEFLVGAGADYFRWQESGTPEVTEEGYMGSLSVTYLQDKDAGTLFAYRGRLWGGSADYEGATLFGGTPLESTSRYAGIGNELQARYRKASKNGSSLDGVFGVGLELWRRELSSAQKEDYSIAYLRLGIESNANRQGQWAVGLGMKYPVWARENAHLDQIGFDSNPILHPGKELSPYGSLGYRFTANFQVVAYYDGFRFGKSDPVQANEVATGQGPTQLVQPASGMSVFGLKLEYALR